MKRYCGPLEFAGTRQISEADRAAFQQAMRIFTRELVFALVFTLGCICLLAAAGISYSGLLKPLHPLLKTVLMGAFTIGTIQGAKLICRSIANIRQIRANRSTTQVDEYRGTLSDDMYAGSLEKVKDLVAKTDKPIILALVPKSEFVISANDEPLAIHCIIAPTQELAVPETQPYSVKLNIRDWIESAKANGKLERRHLTEDEKAELAAKIQLIYWDGIKPLLFLALLGPAIIFRQSLVIAGIAFGLSSLIIWRRTWPCVKLGRNLQLDLDEGDVYFVGQDALAEGNPEFEVLPSGAPWTQRGQPCGIRLLNDKMENQ